MNDMFKGKAAPRNPAPVKGTRSPPFRPFEPGEYVQNEDGSRSTERTITWQMPDGQWVNTPTLFVSPNGVLDLSTPDKEEQARRAAETLMRSGRKFPTFKTLEEAERDAVARSNAGGASSGSFTKRLN